METTFRWRSWPGVSDNVGNIQRQADCFPAQIELRSPPLPFQALLYTRSRKIKELAKWDCSPVVLVLF
jgi:hypothetical protein